MISKKGSGTLLLFVTSHRYQFQSNCPSSLCVPERRARLKNWRVIPMFCTRIRLLCGIATLVFCICLLGSVKLQAQTDPGPRPPGTQNVFCPFTSEKFPTGPNCVDIVQPSAGGADGAGNILANAGNLGPMWFQALAIFETPATVTGPQSGGSSIPGLGPSFNANSCFQCHSQPAVGGSSPNTATSDLNGKFFPGNPQAFTIANRGTAPDSTQISNVSSFISATGPVREARFPSGFAGNSSTFTAEVAAGAVAELFVVTPAIGAPSNCQIGQEPFATEVSNKNIVFRIPIPLFGEGFVENTPDENLQDNLTQDDSIANNANIFSPVLGIKGKFNHSGNDQTISKFGWKAQNKSLLLFAGEAFNVEMGVTNELMTNERTVGNGSCTGPLTNPTTTPQTPEDSVLVLPDPSDPNNRGVGAINSAGGPAAVSSVISENIENFAVFMRLNGAPSQCNWNSGLTTNTNGTTSAACKALDSTAVTGGQIFGSIDPSVSGSFTNASSPGTGSINGIISTGTTSTSTTVQSIGCVLCHSDLLRTSTSNIGSLNNVQFRPFSDFATHVMDSSLADGVIQGQANGNEFRTAPLWGLGQRLFFMHDGRCADLLCAINAHAPNAGSSTSATDNCTTTTGQGEACEVIRLFNGLNSTQKEDVLHFLRSL